MLRELTSEQEIGGKTIRHFVNGGDCLLLVFADDTFIELAVLTSSDCGEFTLDRGEFQVQTWGRRNCVELGICTVEEYDALMDASNARKRAEAESTERLEFERLKLKFGKEAPDGS